MTVSFDPQRKKIKVNDLRGKDLRFIDLRVAEKATIKSSYDRQLNLVAVKIPGEVDLVSG